jgi:anti-sigma B factor antagonist
MIIVKFANDRIVEEKLIQSIGRELMEAVEAANETKTLRMDFSGVQFMSSAMLGKLVLLNTKSKECGIELEFCGMSPSVRDVFRLLGGDGGPGPAAVPAQPRRPPDTDAANAIPERGDD